MAALAHSTYHALSHKHHITTCSIAAMLVACQQAGHASAHNHHTSSLLQHLQLNTGTTTATSTAPAASLIEATVPAAPHTVEPPTARHLPPPHHHPNPHMQPPRRGPPLACKAALRHCGLRKGNGAASRRDLKRGWVRGSIQGQCTFAPACEGGRGVRGGGMAGHTIGHALCAVRCCRNLKRAAERP